MIPYLARLLDITTNNNTIPYDWKKVIVFPIRRGRSIGSWKIYTGQLKFGDLQANGPSYGRVPKTSPGN